MKYITTLLALSLSLLTLSCNKDSRQASSQDEARSNGSEQSPDFSNARPAKTNSKHSAEIDIEKRKKEHHKAMEKAVLDHLGKDEKAGKEALDKAMQKWLNDPVLYGERRYATADQAKDKQISYHLPQKATQIQLVKEPNGHCALYKISEQDLKDHMVMVWERYREEYVKLGGKRWIKHSDTDVEGSLMGREAGTLQYIGPDDLGEPWNRNYIVDGVKIRQVRVPQAVIDSGWKTLGNVMEYQGPIRTNGGSSAYYYDRDSGYAFHDVGYW